MNIRKTIRISAIALLVAMMSVSMAAAYTIDGNLSDWGVTVDGGGDWSQESTWLPNDGVQFQVEDNVDPDSEFDWNGSGNTAYATGVHIIGTGSSYNVYNEPRVGSGSRAGWAFPTGTSNYTAEQYDMEVMYVDEDAGHLYFAIVLSCAANTYSGDLGLDITSATADGYDYEYGVVIHDGAGTYTAMSRNIISVSDWSECTTVTECSPYRILDGTTVGTATVAYVKAGPDPEPSGDYPATYIIEGKIPKSAIGNPASTSSIQYHYTVKCGNDEITIRKVGLGGPGTPVPVLTPPGIIALVGLLGVIGMSRIGRRFN